jgi:hypothetical protein
MNRDHLRIVSDSPWTDERSYAPDLAEALARAASLRPQPASRFSRSGIAIAMFCIIYFALEFLR